MSAYVRTTPVRPSPPWPDYVAAATRTLHAAAARDGALTFAECAALTLGVLPPPLAGALRSRLAALGWLDARDLPVDILDDDHCPLDLRDGRRELVRLALFGPPGQGRPTETKQREAVYQMLCAEIAREATDLPTLRAVASRALGHPDVRADGQLAGMLQSYIAGREAELKVLDEQRHGITDDSQLRHAFGERPPRTTQDDLATDIVAIERARLEFEDHVVHYNEPAARTALRRIAHLTNRHRGLINTTTLRQCEREWQDLVKQCDEFRAHVADLAERGVQATQRGDSITAGWALRRLAVIHALRPALLPDNRYHELRTRIEQATQQDDLRESAYLLVTRERAVAADIRALAVVIRRFQHVAERFAADHPTYRQAEADYRQALRELKSRDEDWMAALVLELNALCEDLHDASGRAATQVDRFLLSVRDSLVRLRREIQQIQPAQPRPAPSDS
jgi:hypothetical protein